MYMYIASSKSQRDHTHWYRISYIDYTHIASRSLEEYTTEACQPVTTHILTYTALILICESQTKIILFDNIQFFTYIIQQPLSCHLFLQGIWQAYIDVSANFDQSAYVVWLINLGSGQSQFCCQQFELYEQFSETTSIMDTQVLAYTVAIPASPNWQSIDSMMGHLAAVRLVCVVIHYIAKLYLPPVLCLGKWMADQLGLSASYGHLAACDLRAIWHSNSSHAQSSSSVYLFSTKMH